MTGSSQLQQRLARQGRVLRRLAQAAGHVRQRLVKLVQPMDSPLVGDAGLARLAAAPGLTAGLDGVLVKLAASSTSASAVPAPGLRPARQDLPGASRNQRQPRHSRPQGSGGRAGQGLTNSLTRGRPGPELLRPGSSTAGAKAQGASAAETAGGPRLLPPAAALSRSNASAKLNQRALRHGLGAAWADQSLGARPGLNAVDLSGGAPSAGVSQAGEAADRTGQAGAAAVTPMAAGGILERQISRLSRAAGPGPAAVPSAGQAGPLPRPGEPVGALGAKIQGYPGRVAPASDVAAGGGLRSQGAADPPAPAPAPGQLAPAPPMAGAPAVPWLDGDGSGGSGGPGGLRGLAARAAPLADDNPGPQAGSGTGPLASAGGRDTSAAALARVLRDEARQAGLDVDEVGP